MKNLEVFRAVCAWCQKPGGIKIMQDERQTVFDDESAAFIMLAATVPFIEASNLLIKAPLSHGICRTCADRLIAARR